MSKKKLDLVITAHPDDETIFFAGLLLQSPGKFRVACVTDGNADGHGALRKQQLEAACEALKVEELVYLNFPDRFEQRLDQVALRTALRELNAGPRIFTHGPIGEYGHPHHQDVSYAAHCVFLKKHKVFSVAHNCYPDLTVKLTPAQFRKKTSILHDIYFSETKRFAHIIPCQPTEGFVRLTMLEVESIYQFLRDGTDYDIELLQKYKWFKDYLPALKEQLSRRPF